MVKDYLKPRTGTVLDKGRSSARVDAGGVVTKNVSVARSIDYNDLKNHDLVGLEWVGDQAYIVSILTWDQAATVLGEIDSEYIPEEDDSAYLEVDADEDEEEEEEAAASSGKQYATFVIAANDSTDDGKASADYVCDGTGDDSEINTALSQSTTSGYMSALLLEGTYTIGASIDQMQSGCTLRGQGDGTILKLKNSYNSSGPVIDTSSVSDIEISNLQIDGNRSGQASGAPECIALSAVTRGIISNVTMVSAGGYGAWLHSSCSSIQIVECTVDDCDIGVYVDTCGNIVVASCVITNIYGWDGIWFGDTPSGAIVDNLIDTTAYSGIYVGNSGSVGITISGNVCRNCYDYGIAIAASGDAAENIAVSGNSCSGSAIGAGIIVADGVRVAISGNACDDNYIGIEVSSGSSYVNLAGNTVSNSARHGIDCDGVYCGIFGNNAYLNGRHGIQVGGTDCSVKGNLCSANSQSAASTYDNINESGTNNSIQANTCRKGTETNMPAYGINAGGSGCLVTNNDLRLGGATGGLGGSPAVSRDNDV